MTEKCIVSCIYIRKTIITINKAKLYINCNYPYQLFLVIVCIVSCRPWPTTTVEPTSTVDKFQEITIPIPHSEIGQNITEIVVHVQQQDDDDDTSVRRILNLNVEQK